MTTRFNGFSTTGRLGYFQGDNALVSILIFATGTASEAPAVPPAIGATGVVAPLAEFKQMYAFDPALEIAANYTQAAQAGTLGDNPAFSSPNTSAAQRTFASGTALADDNAYTAAWAQQTNLRRLIDVIQQRGVVIGVSDVGELVTAKTQGAGDARWSAATATTIGTGTGENSRGQIITFMVERAAVYDRMRPDTYGQPEGTTVEIGRELRDDLNGLPLFAENGSTTVTLLKN